MTSVDDPALKAVQRDTHPLTGAADDYDRLLTLVGDARLVLIGEASHGTHEIYRTRAEITQRLIQEKGFTAVAVEADWPDAYRVNRYVRGVGDDPTANESLADFRRFPTWMWRTRTFSTSSAGCATTTIWSVRTKARPVSTGWTSTACIARSR